MSPGPAPFQLETNVKSSLKVRVIDIVSRRLVESKIWIC